MCQTFSVWKLKDLMTTTGSGNRRVQGVTKEKIEKLPGQENRGHAVTVLTNSSQVKKGRKLCPHAHENIRHMH